MTLRSSIDQPAHSLLRTYVRSEVVVVYKTKEEFGGLSNMASGYPLQINGVRILTTEALYQGVPFPSPPGGPAGDHRAAQPDDCQDEEQAAS
jgi:hypothetical protein